MNHVIDIKHIQQVLEACKGIKTKKAENQKKIAQNDLKQKQNKKNTNRNKDLSTEIRKACSKKCIIKHLEYLSGPEFGARNINEFYTSEYEVLYLTLYGGVCPSHDCLQPPTSDKGLT